MHIYKCQACELHIIISKILCLYVAVSISNFLSKYDCLLFVSSKSILNQILSSSVAYIKFQLLCIALKFQKLLIFTYLLIYFILDQLWCYLGYLFGSDSQSIVFTKGDPDLLMSPPPSKRESFGRYCLWLLIF